jgi:glycerophosphoryl diester phosphodiesterase
VVWTVDTRGALRHWMRPGRAWLVTTNHPALALQLRAAEKIRS